MEGIVDSVKQVRVLTKRVDAEQIWNLKAGYRKAFFCDDKFNAMKVA